MGLSEWDSGSFLPVLRVCVCVCGGLEGEAEGTGEATQDGKKTRERFSVWLCVPKLWRASQHCQLHRPPLACVVTFPAQSVTQLSDSLIG